MFLKKLFKSNKDYNHYLAKGDRYLADERFADARNAYGEALEKIGANGDAALAEIEAIRQKIALTGNMLGRLNLVEAEYALASGDRKKAGEHLHIIMALADDADLREKSEKLQAIVDSGDPETLQAKSEQNCNSCEANGSETGNDDLHAMDENISSEDRLALFFQTLPGDLPVRYAGMGKEFARGCLHNLQGDGVGALRIFEELAVDADHDILNYEKAILYFHNGDSGNCEQLLIKAIGLNPLNPLCSIGLAQLYTELGRVPEALQVLERMISNDLLPEQASLMQGDLYALLENESQAVECYSKLLTSPKFASEAAERIVPLLERQGRSEEAAYLARKFKKGCC
jgi:predicted negative regulator of RcsB-dependent stress response